MSIGPLLPENWSEENGLSPPWVSLSAFAWVAWLLEPVFADADSVETCLRRLDLAGVASAAGALTSSVVSGAVYVAGPVVLLKDVAPEADVAAVVSEAVDVPLLAEAPGALRILEPTEADGAFCAAAAPGWAAPDAAADGTAAVSGAADDVCASAAAGALAYSASAGAPISLIKTDAAQRHSRHAARFARAARLGFARLESTFLLGSHNSIGLAQ